MMMHRLPVLFAVLWILTSALSLHADLVVFGSDSSKSTELADLVNKNADVRSAIAAFERVGDLGVPHLAANPDHAVDDLLEGGGLARV